MRKTLKFSRTLWTKGNGLWSREKRAVKHTKITVVRQDSELGEVRVYFTKRSWDIVRHGLIYTDGGWLKELRQDMFSVYGFSKAAVRDVDYSEQGMQREKYVSLDCGKRFLREWEEKGLGFVEDWGDTSEY